ncbi:MULTISPECIES: molybdopterin-synthase adenylyltransferase MoeB [unclassified Aureispira]|uniref:molybdopterin-synthase adenylyltransferase MoeB n=1 Tax=unclassified Aureispira TaxID=2649989 RepID=UPI0006975596|nr:MULTISPECIES: molybdopterin-synthase adenylyltransferase MoeB [unclassified Aureispira]WMX17238.1 molybdopterin-synthase adenylyltransferase MoeB [Aureispira sp. CCB-E]
MNLNKEDLARYSRHLLLSEIGLEGQKKLKNANVLVIGAGGLGCPILQYLAAAGVGKIGVIDADVLEESNLQRQILYTVADIGVNKALAAQKRLVALNPLIEVLAYPYALEVSNALELFEQYDLVVDGTDNFATRYMVNDACIITNKPLVYGSIFKFEGQVAVFNYQGGPSYRCLFPNPPAPGEVPNCSEVGVLGVLPGVIGAMQANEALKIILGLGDVLSEKLLVYNALTAESLILTIQANAAVITQTKAMKKDFKTTSYEAFCGIKKEEKQPSILEISPQELADNLEQYTLVDVRETWEQPRYETLKGIDIPLPRLVLWKDRIPKDRPVVVLCAKGIRSKIAIEQLQTNYGYNNLINLTGGIKNWEAQLLKTK